MSLNKQKQLTSIWDILKECIGKNNVTESVLQQHREAYLCSITSLWNLHGKEEEAAYKGLPKKFRIIDKDKDQIPFSASGVFTGKQIENALREIFNEHREVKKIFIIDLLKEYHCFIENQDNEMPLSFRAENNVVNYGLPFAEVENLEKIIFEVLNEKNETEDIMFADHFEKDEGAIKDKPEQIIVRKNAKFYTERELIGGLSFDCELSYQRFPCMDHRSPSYEVLISFASFIQNEFNPETDWLHIHCNGGKGRSTSFSLFFDMLMRLQKGSLDTITFPKLLQIHKDSGGRDLNIQKTDDWKQEYAVQRYSVLKSLYKNLIKIQDYGLKDVFSTALTIILLKEQGNLEKQSFKSIVKNSGKLVTKKIDGDLDLYLKLYKFYNEYCGQANYYEEEFDVDDVIDQFECYTTSEVSIVI